MANYADHSSVDTEVQALVKAPDRTRRIGRRDHALLLLAVQTGLRNSEIRSLRRRDGVRTDQTNAFPASIQHNSTHSTR